MQTRRNSTEPDPRPNGLTRRAHYTIRKLLLGRWVPVMLAFAVATSRALAQGALPVSEISPGVYVAVGVHEEATSDNLGAIGNIGFIVGGDAVAIIDTGGSARVGQMLREAVRTVTGLPIRFVINTHVHPDHIMGNVAFVADTPMFIGHRNLPRAMAERGEHYLRRLREEVGPAADGTQLIAPTAEVNDVMEIDLGGRVLSLRAFPAAHTDSDLTIYDVKTGVLWTGDLLFIERVPVVDGSLKGWLAAIGTLRRTEAALIVPGHGPPTAEAEAAFAAQERYLRTLLTEIRTLIAQGGSMEQAVETVGRSERNNWVLFENYHPRNVVTAYAELEWE